MSKVGHLLERLQENAGKDIYPYHMPGHKRRSCGRLPEAVYGIDITEIDGFDNLHQPEGILREAQQEAARLYGAEESFYLVNGSSCGILSAVSCALPFGGHILMARNCHKSAYHAAYLRKLAVSYVYPPILDEYDIFDGVEAGQIQEALERERDIDAVLIVSPTYEGRIADIAGIARVVHQKGIPLIVDEAHGAHLGLGGGLPPNSCQLGADLVIHSVHKTLPALTQTALLHVNGDRIDRERLRRFLRIYQSSSPSYLLMAGIDNALQCVKEDTDIFIRFRERYESMVQDLTERCRYLRFLPVEDGKQDVGKLLVSVKQCGLTGRQLYDILLQKYHLQLEMASVSFVLAMFTVNDDGEGYRRMAQALTEIDDSLGGERAADSFCEGRAGEYGEGHSGQGAENVESHSWQRAENVESHDEQGAEKIESHSEQGAENIEGHSEQMAENVESHSEQGAENVEGHSWQREENVEGHSWQRAENVESHGEQGAEKIESHSEQGAENIEGHSEQGAENVEGHGERGAENIEGHGERGAENIEGHSEQRAEKIESQEKRKRQEERQTDEVPLAEAWDRKTKMVSLEESVGRPIGEFVNLYPPGVPLLVPGERMTERLCRDIRNALEQGLQVQGIRSETRLGETAGMISVPVILL